MKLVKRNRAGWLTLALFAAGMSTQAGTAWNGTVDDNWSTVGNWSAGVPGTDPVAVINATDKGGLINVDVATTGMRTLQIWAAATNFTISGGAMSFSDAANTGDVIVHSGSNVQTINSDINITSALTTTRSFRSVNTDSDLIINGNVTQNTNTFRLTSGKVTMNGSFTGDKFALNTGNHTFANTADNDFNELTFAAATEVTVNTAANAVFFDGARIFFNSTGSKATFNNANVLGDSTGLTIGNATNIASLVFNADETLGTVSAVGTFTIDLGAGVNSLAFANSSGLTWTGGLIINDFRPGVVRFGINGSGLTETQLGQITAYEPGGSLVANQMILDNSGYLMEETGVDPGTETEEPSVTLMWSSDLYPGLTPAQFHALGVNRVWLEDGSRAILANLQNNGLEVQGPLNMAGFSGLNDEQYTDDPRTFLPSKPVTATSNGALAIPLLSGYDASLFAMENGSFFRPYWKVWNRTTRTALPASAWTYASGVVTVKAAQSGHEYNVGFSARRLKVREMQDIFPAAFRATYLQDYIDAFQIDLRDVLRVIGFSFYFYRTEMPDGTFLDWYGPGSTIGQGFIEAYEARYGKPFDLDAFMEIGTLRSTNDERHPGYREMLEVYREMAQSFAPEFNAMVHGQGRKNRFFWGDAWVGVEPQLPVFAEQGFDEITTVVGNPQDVRRLMTVAPSVQRNNRFGMWGVQVGDGLSTLSETWTAFLRGALRTFPEGISFGGPEISTLLQDEPGFEEALAARIADFRFLHGKLHGKKSFEHDLTVGILNSYGQARAWPREFTMNNSQNLWRGLVDSPFKVRWLNFDDIAGGVPAEIDVLINVGEPDSAWSGGVEWTTGAVASVETFVQNGGAFIGIDAPGVNSGTGMLGGVLGLSYDGTASAAAAAGIFNSYDRIRNFLASSPSSANFSLTLSPSAASELGTAQGIGSAKANSVMTVAAPSVARLDSGSGTVGFSKNSFGAGTAWYIRNVPVSETGFDFLERLIYTAAGRPEWRSKLYCRTIGGFVYYYPFERLLVAFNENSSSSTLSLDLGLFSGFDHVELNGLNGPAADKTYSGSALGSGPVGIQLPAESFAVWEVNGSHTDSDGDGIPDYWEWTHSGSTTGLVATADNDGDGRSNAQEYAADTVPGNPASRFKVDRIETAPDPKVVFDGSTNRFFQLFYSTNGLADPAFQWMTGDWVQGNGQNSAIDFPATDAPSMFFRLDAHVP